MITICLTDKDFPLDRFRNLEREGLHIGTTIRSYADTEMRSTWGFVVSSLSCERRDGQFHVLYGAIHRPNGSLLLEHFGDTFNGLVCISHVDCGPIYFMDGLRFPVKIRDDPATSPCL